MQPQTMTILDAPATYQLTCDGNLPDWMPTFEEMETLSLEELHTKSQSAMELVTAEAAQIAERYPDPDYNDKTAVFQNKISELVTEWVKNGNAVRDFVYTCEPGEEIFEMMLTIAPNGFYSRRDIFTFTIKQVW